MRLTLVLLLPCLAASCFNMHALSDHYDGGGGGGGADDAGTDGGACPGELLCNGACVPNDSTNCGTCGNACAAPTSECIEGTCSCPGDGLVCGGTCVANDQSNCGMCGNACAAGTYCDDVACESPWAGWPMPNPTGSTDPQSGAKLPNQASYDTSMAGVVIDNVTHLMWQRDVSLQTFVWSDAKSQCAHLSLAGHDDWRLPTDIELFSLLDFTQSPAIDPSAFPSTPADKFWTSSPFVGDPTWAYYIDFGVGNTYYWNVTDEHYARCVR